MKKCLCVLLVCLLAAGAFAESGNAFAPYLGTWYFDGFEVVITEEGKAELYQNGEKLAEDDISVGMGGMFMGETPIALDENGNLACGTGTNTMIGSRLSAEEQLAAFDLAPYLGSWYMGDYRIEITEDGQAAQYIGGEFDAYFPLGVRNGMLTIDGMPCAVNEDGELVCGSGDYTVTATREQ